MVYEDSPLQKATVPRYKGQSLSSNDLESSRAIRRMVRHEL